jgi:hypothetical protein
MPKERVQHGALFVIEQEGATEATDVYGEPIGIKAHRARPYAPGEILSAGETLEEQPSVDVTWRRDPGWVQVSVEASADWWDRFQKSRERVEQSHFGVFSEVMSRQEINHMIRTLRRARDAAYGSDE